MTRPMFSPATELWFSESFAGPTPAQAAAWPAIQAGANVLLVAPTGSGKTLSAFLAAIDGLLQRPAAPPGVRVLYISPLKALAVDVERNLAAPLSGILRTAARILQPVSPIRVDVRTGDTPTRERAAFRKNPGDILVTTPESLYLLLTTGAAEALRTVEVIILDEVHVLAGTKRGVHLQLSLERLSAITDRDPQRIGLSATVRPLAVAAAFLGGDRPVLTLDTSERPHIELQIVVPAEDMERPPLPMLPSELPATYGSASATDHAYPTNQPKGGMWPAIHPVLLELIRGHRSTLIFTNSRLLCERLSRSLNELAGTELVRAHHGSVSHEQRAALEAALKAGTVPALVATSSLELGIDMGAIDLVILVASPGSVARGLQRVGRAGHQVGAVSVGRMFPRHRSEIIECAVVARHMAEGRIESTALPTSCLDVLAQQIVAMVSVSDWSVPDLHMLVRRAASYRNLSREALDSVLDLVSGRYPSNEMADLTPTVVWDRTSDQLSPRRNARLMAVLNGGTIPDRGLYRVRVGPGGPRVGELDEEMVYESRPGDKVVLGATTWRIDDIQRDEVIVSPAPGEPGRLAFWRGESPGRPIELGRAIGAFMGQLMAVLEGGEIDPTSWLKQQAPLDDRAVRNLLAFVGEQREATGECPTDRTIVVESFRDELGDWRVCLLTPFGVRVHAPWAMAIEAAIGRRTGVLVQTLYSDDGISLRVADSGDLPDPDLLIPDPDEVEEAVLEQVRHASLFAGRFRENAARALLLPRRNARGRQPLWLQRRKSESLLSAVAQHPSFPIVLETYREVLHDVFDMPALVDLLRRIRRREVRLHHVETRSASPMSRSLVFQYIANQMYSYDAPMAERRAMALALDRGLLAELLGQDGLRDLLDPEAIVAVEQELQQLTGDRQIDHPDRLHDLLRRLGDLSLDEIGERSSVDAVPLAEALRRDGRAFEVHIGGQPRWVAAEEAALWRDALGLSLPAGLPAAFLLRAPADAAPVESLVRRYARTRGPFTAVELASRYGWTPAQIEPVLRALYASGHLVFGALRPTSPGDDWCDVEVLRRIKRRTLARLRKEIEPVTPEVYAAFLPGWHGLDEPREGLPRLAEVVAQLEGAALPWSDLEERILPARISRYQPMLLDQLGAMGQIVWIGRGAQGLKDGLVALYRRDRVAELWEPHPWPADGSPAPALHAAILDHLGRRGACFFTELVQAVGEARKVGEALADLAWAGQITNDTLQPLRAFAQGQAARPSGGRWSRTSDLVLPVEPTARASALAMTLLDRHGVLARDHALAEELPGGWQPLYHLLSAFEDAGRVRRGWFIEGLGSAQFASPGAVERLRRQRQPDVLPVARWLAATDPAQPWGSVLPWPREEQAAPGEARPRRIPGARVGLLGGRAIAWLGASGHLILLPGALEEDRLVPVLAALRADLGWRSLRVEKVDGQPAAAHPSYRTLLALGFKADLKGLILERTA